MINIKNKFIRNIRGTVLPVAALLVAVIIPLCGLTVDVSYMGILRGSLDRATEAAAVAGANEYFRSMADAGKAINETMQVFKMNVSTSTTVERYYGNTGAGRPETLTFSKTFTEAEGIQVIYRGQPISVTAMTELNRGRITVTSQVTPSPFFSQIFSAPTPITVTKTAQLPPYDISFVFDLSGSMRFATVNTYIGVGRRRPAGSGLPTVPVTDVILYHSPYQVLGRGQVITANGFETTIDGITDVVINTPGLDLPTNARYTNGNLIYIRDPKRGFITNAVGSYDINRPFSTQFSGFTKLEAGIRGTDEAMTLAQTINENRTDFRTYFDRAAAYIEPHASAAYGVMSFIDTVRIYGTAQLNLALVTFQSDSTINAYYQNWWAPELRSILTGQFRRIVDNYPHIRLVEPRQFNDIYDALTIMILGGGFVGPTRVNSYPNGGTNISAGLENAWQTFERSGRRNRNPQRVIIIFTDGDPSGADSYPRLGRTVRSLTDRDVTVYSIVLTLAVGQGTINAFRSAVENVGGAEPVIFISDPAQIDEAFINIANDLGLRLVN